jgi:hypothetical protein
MHLQIALNNAKLSIIVLYWLNEARRTASFYAWQDNSFDAHNTKILDGDHSSMELQGISQEVDVIFQNYSLTENDTGSVTVDYVMTRWHNSIHIRLQEHSNTRFNVLEARLCMNFRNMSRWFC